MDAPQPWPVRVAAIGPVAVGTTLWRYEGQLSVTVIVKATFRLVHNDAMTVVAPERLRTFDQYAEGVPPSSLCGVRETAPLLQQAEVVLFGHGYAPRSDDTGSRQPTAKTTVRLSVGRQENAWIDKSLLVVGSRRGKEPPEPFERIPICYERALGGPGFADNPIGVGLEGRGEQSPNLLSVHDPFRAVACFGPLPSFFPARERLRGGCPSAAMDGGLVDIARDFDWRYFHAAPADQRLAALHGDEWVELTGLCPYRHTLYSALPAVRAVTTVYGHCEGNTPSEVPVVADLLILEPDELKCALVWRGSFPVPSRAACQTLVVAGALEIDGAPVTWPATLADALALGAPPPAGAGVGLTPSFDDSPPLFRPIFAQPAPTAADDGGDGPVAFRTGFLDTSELEIFQQAIRSAIDRRASSTAAAWRGDPETTSVLPPLPDDPVRPPPAVGFAPSHVPLSDPTSPSPDDADPEQDQETAVKEGGLVMPDGDPGRDLATAVQGPAVGQEDEDPEQNLQTAVLDGQAGGDGEDPEQQLKTAVQGRAETDGMGVDEEQATRVRTGTAEQLETAEDEEVATRVRPGTEDD